MANYEITVEVNQQWFDILGQISRHQEGFVWVSVRSSDERVLRTSSNGTQFLGDE
jgi:hypothetical protein